MMPPHPSFASSGPSATGKRPKAVEQDGEDETKRFHGRRCWRGSRGPFKERRDSIVPAASRVEVPGSWVLSRRMDLANQGAFCLDSSRFSECALSGCALSGRTLLDGRHIRAEDCIHARLVPGPLFLEPSQNILIDPKGDGLLGRRVNDGGVCKEVSREICEFGRRGSRNAALARLPKAGELRPSPAGFLILARGLRSTLGVHGDCSGGLR
jgi:hypothetical protein